MSDHPTRPDLPPDELVSAHVDGLTDPEQAARVEADPALRARLARLQAARDAVRVADLAPDADRREAAIAAALAAASAEPSSAPADELAARRRDGTRRLGWVAAVAAALVLALVLPRVLDRSDGSDAARTAAADAPPSPESATASGKSGSTTARDSMADGPLSSSSAAATAGGPCCSLAELGTAAELEDLVGPARRALEPSDSAVPSSAPPPSEQEDACLARLESTATTPADPSGEPPTVVLRARATVGDQPVVVVVIEQPDGARELLAAAASSCDLLGAVDL